MTLDLTGKPPHPVSRDDALMARCLVMWRGVPPRDVDDITQEVLFALAFHHKPLEVPERRTHRTLEQARTATIAAATRIQLTEHARRQAQLRRGDVLGAEVFSARFTPSAEDLALAFAPIGRLRRALAKLEQSEPALYRLLDLTIDGATMTAAAARLRLPLGTVCTRLRMARAAVRVLFRRESLPQRADDDGGGVTGGA